MTLRPETRIISAGRPPHETDQPLSSPIVPASAYIGQGSPAEERSYARSSNPTWEPFEEALASLESSELPALLFSSGLSAIAASLSLVPEGAVVLFPRNCYPGTLALARDLESRGQLSVEQYDVAPDSPVLERIAEGNPENLALWLESPGNPLLEVSDLPVILREAKARGVLSIADNTFATPLVQRPLELGADVVVHSVTKYLAGHSDLVMGAAVTSDSRLRTRLATYRTLHGAIAGPFEAWLALRGLRTLSVRVQRSQENALELARRLEQHPAVESVRHPSLTSDPSHEVAFRTLEGYGSIISICLAGGVAEADEFIRAVRLWTPATSLGGVESTLERRHRHPGESSLVPEHLIRLSVGIEHADDLWADLEQALSRSHPGC